VLVEAGRVRPAFLVLGGVRRPRSANLIQIPRARSARARPDSPAYAIRIRQQRVV